MLTPEILDSISNRYNMFCFAFNLHFYRFTTMVGNDLSTPYSIFRMIIILIDDSILYIRTLKNDILFMDPTAARSWENPNGSFANNESTSLCTFITYSIQPALEHLFPLFKQQQKKVPTTSMKIAAK